MYVALLFPLYRSPEHYPNALLTSHSPFCPAYQPYTEYSSVTGGGFDQGDSRPSSGDSAAGSRVSTLTPVTIKQILNSSQTIQDGPFVFQQQELHHVVFVGVVRNIADHTSNIFVTLEDGTGQIEVRKWSDETSDIASSQGGEATAPGSSQVAQQFRIGSYVKVYGALKEFGGKKNIQYAVIKNIESYNDILAHHLDAIKWHSIATGKIPDPSANGEATATGNSASTPGKSLFVSDTSADNPQRVLAFCKEQCEGKDGSTFAVPLQLICQTLNLDENTARQCCTQLTEQGFVYPTLDDDHFFAL